MPTNSTLLCVTKNIYNCVVVGHLVALSFLLKVSYYWVGLRVPGQPSEPQNMYQ